MRTPLHLMAAALLLAACGGDGLGKTPPAQPPSGSGGSDGGSGGAAGASPPAGGAGGSVSGGAGGSVSGGAGGSAGSGYPPDAAPSADAGPGADPGVTPGVLPGSHLIFDGKTLDGWDGDTKIWSVKDGAIDGLAQNGGQLIVTRDTYDSFRISGQAKMVQSDNHLGVCFWGGTSGHGYGKCIVFVPPSGSIWDYGGPGNVRTLKYVWNGMPVDKHQWHQFEILANAMTGSVRMGVDGHEFPVYRKAGRGHKAVVGLQIHAGFSEVAYKDLAIEVNPTEDRLLSVKAPPLP